MGLSGDGRLIDPVPGQGLGEDVGGGVVVTGDDVGLSLPQGAPKDSAEPAATESQG